uniref:CNNM transmembrane domain-containing protein n=1 Tax=Quercus lobata TaxID=97700 RepID=A0A7N2MHJ0_QUELO
MFLFICFLLLLFAGITYGLALGLLSFNQVDLEVIIKAGEKQAQKNAAKIMPIVKNQHLLLCTLLIGKSLALEALPIFMDTILLPWAAILVSAPLVLAFIEIIPQALSSRYALSLGAKFAALVSLLLFLFFPISYPISKIVQIIVDMLLSVITHTMGLIMSKGHSSIPIYSGYPTNMVGLILVRNSGTGVYYELIGPKTLIFCCPEDEMPIKYMAIRSIPRRVIAMAVVVKSNEDAKALANSSISNPSMLTINTNTSSCPMLVDHRDYFSARTANVIKQDENLASQYKRSVQGDENVLHENVESHRGNLDEEVIGIITMKDIMEELLQNKNQSATIKKIIVKF